MPANIMKTSPAGPPDRPAPLEPTTPPPHPVVAARLALAGACTLMLAGLVVDLSAGAPATRVFWPVEIVVMVLFFSTMASQGRQWGRVTLAALVATTVVFQLPGLLTGGGDSGRGGVERSAVAATFDVVSIAVLLLGVLLMFLPSANTYVRANRDRARLVPPRIRKALLAAHITSSVGWLGIISVMATMAIAAASADGSEFVGSAYRMMLLVDETFLGPAHQLALLTGVALAAGTRWGVWRRRWVAAKLALLLGMMLVGSLLLQDLALEAHAMVEAGRPVAEIRNEVGLLLAVLTPLGPLTGITATLLSVYKPGGLTRYGRRQSRGGAER